MSARPQSPIDAWKAIPALVQGHVDGLTEAELDRRPDPESLTLRELVHHVAEANVVAASIVIAALGSPGSAYDWSWMMPFGAWVERLDYARKPIGPALRMLSALNAYVVALVEPLPDGLARTVRLKDAADAELRTATVGDVLQAEADHAREHFAGIRR
jgi:hypothetical protein